MRRYALIVCCIVVLLGLAVWSWLSHIELHETALAQQNSPGKPSPTTSRDHEVANPPEPLTKPEVDSSLDLQQCNDFIDQLGEFEMVWWHEKLKQREYYLAQGYSLDEITVAMEELDIPFYGGDWRASQLRKSLGLAGTKNLDSPYQQFSRMQPEQRSELMSNKRPNVNDVALAMVTNKVSDLEIMSMFRLVEEDKRVVSLDWNNSLSLVDWALEYGRPRVALELMDAGVEPSSDRFLANSLELALFNMLKNERAGTSEDTLQSYGQVVKRLLDSGQLARIASQKEIVGYQISSLNKVFLSLPDRNEMIIFRGSDIKRYWEKYRLDLNEIISRPAFVSDTSLHRLKNQLEDERLEQANIRFQVDSAIERVKDCLEFKNAFAHNWQRYKAFELINQSFTDFAVTDARAEVFLQSYDPSLVDCRRVNVAKRGMREAVGNSKQVAARSNALSNEPGKETASSKLSDYTFWMNLSNLLSDPELDLPSNYGGSTPHYWLLSISDFTLEKVQRMISSGMDLRVADSVGRYVTHYAVIAGEPELLEWLIDNDYPYHSLQFGQDPLHLALDIRARPNNSDIIVELVQALLASELEIDEHHRRRLALIKARQPDLYARLSYLDSQMQIDDDQQFPLTYCELYGYLPSQYSTRY